VVGGAILNFFSILKFWKKVSSTIFFLWIDIFKTKVSNDLQENWLNYGVFVSGGHLECLRHFDVLILKIHIFFFLWYRLPKYIVRSTVKFKLVSKNKVSNWNSVSFKQLSNRLVLEKDFKKNECEKPVSNIIFERFSNSCYFQIIFN
jgi:hypothetical protein